MRGGNIIETKVYPRAGMMGNPSDAYGGKTISFTFSNFSAEAQLWESPTLVIKPNKHDRTEFDNEDEMVADINLHGYHGGIPIIRACIKRFSGYCKERGIEREKKNYTIKYDTDIPRGLGLAGSSAIITAVLRALMEFYSVEIPLHLQPNIILESETKELGISAGLQDRVAQVYGGLVYMDFSPEVVANNSGYGHYEKMDSSLLPSGLFIAFNRKFAKVSGRARSLMDIRFERGDPAVVGAMRKLAHLTDEAKKALEAGEYQRLGELMNENYETRKLIYTEEEGGKPVCKLRPSDMEMVELGRRFGAYTKFCGSGGSVLGLTLMDNMDEIRAAYEGIGCEFLVPKPVA